jgi:hypothetical protein
VAGALTWLYAAGAFAESVDAAEQLPRVDAERGSRAGSPLDELPAHVHLVSPFGMRPDWSPDGRTLAFLDRPLGRVFLADVASGAARAVTEAETSFGFLRAHFLANGDLLLCGPARAVDASRPEAGRFEGVLWIQRAPFRVAPRSLGMPCWEGVATSRRSLRIAWNRSDVRFTEASPRDFVGEIWTGEVGYDERGDPYLFGVEKAFDRASLPYAGVPEVQGFRGARDRELVFTGYGREGIEVFGYDTRTRELRNYSNSPVYEEAEGLSPDGSWILVERNVESTSEPGALDIWRLWLGAGRWERLTHFNRYRGEQFPWYASNPVVSPDGRRFAFQLSIDGPTEGEGKGILIYELTRCVAPAAHARSLRLAGPSRLCQIL